jgi:hypothetical protein
MKQQPTTNYAGIDYGMDQTNINRSTGIRYGVISQHGLCEFALDDMFQNATNPDWDEAVKELEKEHGDDSEAFDAARETLSGQWESNRLLYERDGYKLKTTTNGELFVLCSPYFTHAQFCSPCAPGAGNLNEPSAHGPKTYCLGVEFFENDKPPYPVFSVATGVSVESEVTK